MLAIPMDGPHYIGLLQLMQLKLFRYGSISALWNDFVSLGVTILILISRQRMTLNVCIVAGGP